MNDRLAKMKARDKAMRQARDKMLRHVSQHLTTIGFTKASAGHFVRPSQGQTDHIGLQKHAGGRDVRVMTHVTLEDAAETTINGPWSDTYTRPESPNGIRYCFSWSTKEEDITRCAEEFCHFIDDVVIKWFANPKPL
ncbi:MAG TPA: hypothetical protein DDW52_27085 [Planctomycetaceae bacterium]|nr:hypothetical protein [Planctomycetaceae bacterium]